MSKKKNKAEEDPIKDTSPVDEAQETETAAKSNAGAEAASEMSPLEEQLQSEKEKYLRLAAEYDNFRKRSVKEREAIFSDVRGDTVLKFLPVYDNLARALLHETVDEAYRKGVEMTMNQLREILDKIGVTEIEALGKTFDPELHNAVMHTEDENYGESEIILEFEKGFKLGDKVIRFSMVQVAN